MSAELECWACHRKITADEIELMVCHECACKQHDGWAAAQAELAKLREQVDALSLGVNDYRANFARVEREYKHSLAVCDLSLAQEKLLADAQRRGMQLAPCGHALKYETFGIPGAIGCLCCELDQARSALARYAPSGNECGALSAKEERDGESNCCGSLAR